MPAALAESLAEIAVAIRVDGCRLFEFGNAGALSRVHDPAVPNTASDRAVTTADQEPEDWLVQRLGSGETVSISRPEDLPREAILSRQQARSSAPYSILGTPATSGGQVVCALVVDGGRLPRRWPAALVERMQLLTEILAAAVQRGHHETALRANVTVIEQLNARLEADNGYLKEEIKSYHDFDDIVGDSASLRVALARLSQVAPTNSTVLLLGPTGTGKELFARALHERSRRHARPLVRVNCAALAAVAGRERTVRPRERRLHRRRGASAGPVRARRWRHDFPG